MQTKKFKIPFTPCADWMIKRYDLETAAVFGRIWRYSIKNGYCNASLETIADDLNLNYKTVQKRIKKLREEKLIEDHSENLKNHPHTYTIKWETILKIETESKLASQEKYEQMLKDVHSIMEENNDDTI